MNLVSGYLLLTTKRVNLTQEDLLGVSLIVRRGCVIIIVKDFIWAITGHCLIFFSSRDSRFRDGFRSFRGGFSTGCFRERTVRDGVNCNFIDGSVDNQDFKLFWVGFPRVSVKVAISGTSTVDDVIVAISGVCDCDYRCAADAVSLDGSLEKSKKKLIWEI